MYELQELTTDCANQLRSSRTEHDSDTNPNICQFVGSYTSLYFKYLMLDAIWIASKRMLSSRKYGQEMSQSQTADEEWTQIATTYLK